MTRLSSFQAALLRTGGHLVASGGRGGALLVLTYHRVLPAKDPLLPDEPDAAEFTWQMDVLQQVCNVLPLPEAVQRLRAGTLPPRAVCITFDDGYLNNYSIAAPILAQRRLPATVFVATGFIGGGRMWNDTVIEAVRRAEPTLDLRSLGLGEYQLGEVSSRQRVLGQILEQLKYRPFEERLASVAAIAALIGKPLPEDLMMDESHIKALSKQGIEVGAHTVTHPILAAIDADKAREEIRASKSTLEAIIGKAVTVFAYPNGRPQQDYRRDHVEMVRQTGFVGAVSTAWGAAGATADVYQIPRMLPWDKSAFKFAARLLGSYREQSPQIA